MLGSFWTSWKVFRIRRPVYKRCKCNANQCTSCVTNYRGENQERIGKRIAEGSDHKSIADGLQTDSRKNSMIYSFDILLLSLERNILRNSLISPNKCDLYVVP